MEIRVGGKYRILRFLGSGSFGKIYQGINLKTNEQVALKMEGLNVDKPCLQYEGKVLAKFQGDP